jgi:hypothetical protein
MIARSCMGANIFGCPVAIRIRLVLESIPAIVARDLRVQHREYCRIEDAHDHACLLQILDLGGEHTGLR